MSRAAFMFSGGVDSTVGAVQMLDSFDEVHLLTWDTGRGMVRTEWSRKSAQVLIDRFPGRVVHHLGDCNPEFDSIVTRRLLSLYRDYRSRFVWCLGCKISMHIASIRYCRDLGIEDSGDGSATETDYYVEQMPVSIDWIRSFYERHGVQFHTPLHHFESREDKVCFLDGLGLRRGRTVLGRNPGTQPFCVAGNAIYLRSTVLKQHPTFDESTVSRFLAEQEGLFEGLLEG